MDLSSFPLHPQFAVAVVKETCPDVSPSNPPYIASTLKTTLCDRDETRTRNLLIRSQTPYPLGHAAGHRSRFMDNACSEAIREKSHIHYLEIPPGCEHDHTHCFMILSLPELCNYSRLICLSLYSVLITSFNSC